MASFCPFKTALLLIASAPLVFGDILENWHVRDSVGKSVGRIVYSGELFVATGLGGAVLTSPDGVNWTARDSGTTNTFASLTYGNGIFLASAFVNGGYVLHRSTNGINWTQVQWPSYERISALGFAEGKLLLFSKAGPSVRDTVQVFASTNGLNWTSRINTGIPGGTVHNFTSTIGVHVGVGEIIDQAEFDPRAGVMASSNLVDWAGIEFYFNRYTLLLDVAYGNGTFVAVGEAQASYPPGVVAVSADGFAWTLRQTHLAGLASIAFGKGVFVALQRDGVITTSRDGVNWTLHPTAYPALWGVEFGADTFVIGGPNQVLLQSDPLVILAARRNGQLAIDGPLGKQCRIEYVTALQLTNVWLTATNLVLTNKPTLWTDPDAATQPRRFYRTVLVE